MNNNDPAYNLVHITTTGEYKTPLVASQLFDQAECQAINKGNGGPQRVEAWIIGAMREYWDEAAKNKLQSLRNRCPHISIHMINGVSRLGKFPIPALLRYRRSKLGAQTPVIYHCRGENAAEWALTLKAHYPADKVVLDVRGYWPAELLYNKGIDDPAKATGADRDAFDKAFASLSHTIAHVDGVTTISRQLRALLQKDMNAPTGTAVVPCCVGSIATGSKRQVLRKDWGIADDETVIVYSGTTAAYQHLHDLTIPFMKVMAAQNPKVRLAFLSSELEKIKKLLIDADAYNERVILKSMPQQDVADALTACDIGILVRKPTLVNQVANPVKIAEYMAAGLPLIIERGVGGVADTLFDSGLLHGISISTGAESMEAAAEAANKWLAGGLAHKRAATQEYARQHYLWSAAIHTSRKLYAAVLAQANNNK